MTPEELQATKDALLSDLPDDREHEAAMNERRSERIAYALSEAREVLQEGDYGVDVVMAALAQHCYDAGRRDMARDLGPVLDALIKSLGVGQ